jgi:hypothetical protein
MTKSVGRVGESGEGRKPTDPCVSNGKAKMKTGRMKEEFGQLGGNR